MDAKRTIPDIAVDHVGPSSRGASVRMRRTLLLGFVAVALLLLLLFLFVVLKVTGDSAGPGTSARLQPEPPELLAATATPEEELTTSVPITPRLFGKAPPGALWPLSARGSRFDDAREAAGDFARRYVGFADPLIGRYRSIDPAYGQVEVQAAVDGPITMIQVHRSATDGTWWVMGASAENIVLDAPRFNESVGSPLYVAGEALAIGGEVGLELRATGVVAPVLTANFVTGTRSESDWFEGAFGWTHPGGSTGAVVLVIRTPEEGQEGTARNTAEGLTGGGQVWEATVVPVTLAETTQGETGV